MREQRAKLVKDIFEEMFRDLVKANPEHQVSERKPWQFWLFTTENPPILSLQTLKWGFKTNRRSSQYCSVKEILLSAWGVRRSAFRTASLPEFGNIIFP